MHAMHNISFVHMFVSVQSKWSEHEDTQDMDEASLLLLSVNIYFIPLAPAAARSVSSPDTFWHRKQSIIIRKQNKWFDYAAACVWM